MFNNTYFPPSYFEQVYFVNVYVNTQTPYSDVTSFVLELEINKNVDKMLTINRQSDKELEINRQLEFTLER